MTIVTPLTLSLIKSRTGARSRWLRAGLSFLFIVDLAFLLANLTKLQDGGWLPLTSGFIIYWLMQTWATGRASVLAKLLREQKPVRDFLVDLKRDPPVRVPGTAIFMDAKASGIPRALLNNLKFNRVIHEQVVLLTVVTREQPRIAETKRLTVTPVCEGIVRLVAAFGFMEKPNIPDILRAAEAHGVVYEPERTTYFLSREELLPGQRSDLPPLRRRAFMQMARSAQVIADYYGLPSGRVMVVTPLSAAISSTSALRCVNRPTVTTPAMPLTVSSICMAAASSRRSPCTSRITLPLSVTVPSRHTGVPPSFTS